jgi:agmatinase
MNPRPRQGWVPGGFLPREVLKLVQLVSAPGLAGIEIVDCSPPYDNADITSLVGVPVVRDIPATLMNNGRFRR